MEFLNQQKILYHKQYGFCKARTKITLIDNKESAIDNRVCLWRFLLTSKKLLIHLITIFYLKKCNTMVSDE